LPKKEVPGRLWCAAPGRGYAGGHAFSAEFDRDSMRFNVLGRLEVVVGSGQRILIPRPRARQLFVVLVLMHGQPLSAEFLA
jgi:hypothetical protein